MTKFAQPCFVSIDDAETRKKLIEWCSEIGYRKSKAVSMAEWAELVFVDGERVSCSDNCRYLKKRYRMIDCGENVERFKALSNLKRAGNMKPDVLEQKVLQDFATL